MPAGTPGHIVEPMATIEPAASDPAKRTFLAERYRSGRSPADADSEAQAAGRAARQLSSEGRPVVLLGALLVPGDETLFSLFWAASKQDVAAVGERAAQPYDRISEGVPTRRARSRLPVS